MNRSGSGNAVYETESAERITLEQGWTITSCSTRNHRLDDCTTKDFSSCGFAFVTFRFCGGLIQNRFVSNSKSSSTVMNDLNVIKKFLLNVVSIP